MATLTGVLLDVSDSMRQNAGGEIKEEGGEWARAIFKVIDGLIKHDVSTDNYIFSVGVGANGSRPLFDVIETVKEVKYRYKKLKRKKKEAFLEMHRKNSPCNGLQLERSLKSLDMEIKQEESLYVDMQREHDLHIEMQRETCSKSLDPDLQWGKTSYMDMEREKNVYTAMQQKKNLCLKKQREKISDKEKQWLDTFVIKMEPEKKYHEYRLVERNYNEMYVHVNENRSDFLARHSRQHRDILPAYDDVLEEFYKLVENNGAQTLRLWAPKDKIQQVVCYRLAVYILDKLKTDEEFLKIFIQKCLPLVCRDFGNNWKVGKFLNIFCSQIASTVLLKLCEIVENISVIVEKAKLQNKEVQSRRFAKYFDETCLKGVGSVFSFLTASEILRDFLDEDMLAERKTNKIMKAISPLIYGKTPLFHALDNALPIFSKDEFSEYTKVLFVLSDGLPTDCGGVHYVSERLKHIDVTVVGCFINRYSKVKPRKLYSVEKEEWDEGAKFLFKLSSTISTHLLPRTIFIKRGWDIDISNNETKLFLQINHPDHIHEACDLARNVVCCQDSLSDLLVSVSLDIYINQSTSGLKAQLQVGRTCYANASAAVLHLSMKRILGRDGGYPDFIELREKIIKLHGKDGANTLNVLEGITPEYRLHCKPVDAKDAMKAIAAKRPVVARFRLTDPEWEEFKNFYEKNPKGILTKSEIDLSKRDPRAILSGHAVVLTSFNSNSFQFMNSWGHDWGNKGFFKVQNSKLLDFEFIDVFWTLNDLSKRETDYFKEHGADVANKIMKNLTSLQEAKYKCPLCTVISLVTEFSGSLKEAVCPKCKGKFRSDRAGNILALNMYLTSISK